MACYKLLLTELSLCKREGGDVRTLHILIQTTQLSWYTVFYTELGAMKCGSFLFCLWHHL